MTHTALARKYRPTRFGDLVGQEHVASGLRGAVAKSRVGHAYLLAGPRGVGKTTAARVLAMALNCERRGDDGEPCAECDSCRRIWSGAANLDVVEIDAASNRGVDDARDLRERAMYAASGPERFKVYIIDEAHMLTREAWNALLKILEEPPPRVIFVFATTEPHKIANTAAPVLSRVQRFDFRRMSPAVIVERLRHVVDTEQVPADDDALGLIARVAAGGMRDALSLLDQALAFGDGAVSVERVRESLGLIDDETYTDVLTMVAERRPADVFPLVARLVDAGADLGEFVNDLGDVLRALMMRVLGGEPPALTEGRRAALDAVADRFTPGDVLRMLHLLQDAETGVRRSANVRLHVETLLLRFTLLDRTVDLQAVLDGLGGAPPPPAPSARPEREAPRRRPRRGGEVLEDAAPARPGPPASAGPPADGDLASRWPEVVAAVRSRRPMLAAALEHASPAGVEGTTVRLAVSDSAVHLEGLERNRSEVETGLAAVLGPGFTVVYEPEGAAPAPPAPRLDQAGDRGERLKAYRAKDQALDAMAEALDLELLD